MTMTTKAIIILATAVLGAGGGFALWNSSDLGINVPGLPYQQPEVIVLPGQTPPVVPDAKYVPLPEAQPGQPQAPVTDPLWVPNSMSGKPQSFQP